MGKTLTPEEKALSELRDKYNATDGTLPKNEIIEKLTNKIGKQEIIRTFNFGSFKLANRFIKKSTLYGGIDELVNVGLGYREDFDLSKDWTKERFIPEINAQWAIKEYEDKYFYTIFYQKMAQALIGMGQVGSLLGEIAYAMTQKKELTWYRRILTDLTTEEKGLWIDIELEPGDLEKQVKEITNTLKKIQLPNDKYNAAGRINATPLESLMLVWNANDLNDLEWLTTSMFDKLGVKTMDRLLGSDVVDYDILDKNEDGTPAATKVKKPMLVVCPDTKIYIGEKYVLTGTQPFVSLKYTNYYLHEEYNKVVLPWIDGVRFFVKESAPASK